MRMSREFRLGEEPPMAAYFFKIIAGVLFFGCFSFVLASPAAPLQGVLIHNSELSVSVRPADGVYEVRAEGLAEPVLEARVAAEINHHWVRSSDYPQHRVAESTFTDALGSGHQLAVIYSGLASAPNLER